MTAAIMEYQPDNVLSAAERQRLESYEAEIENLQNRSYDLLLKIKTENLWREHLSFDNYIQARWNSDSRRRRNQLLAGLRVYIVLSDGVGTGVPIANSEYTMRPLVSVASNNPQLAVQIYEDAVRLANGSTPSHSDIMLARQMALTPDQIKRENALVQIEGMKRYQYLIDDVKTGGADASKALALAVALESCAAQVRRVFVHFDVRDLALIRALNDDFVRGSETAAEIVASGFVQCEFFAVKLNQATARQYRQVKDIAYRERQQQARDAKLGAPESILVFHGDMAGTLESLKQALSYTEIIVLGRLIGEM